MQNITRRIRIGWYLYDWANSSFVTTVVTTFLGPYLTAIARSVADGNGFFSVLGVPIYSDSLFTYLVSISVILQAILLPFLGSFADLYGLKRFFLYFFAFLGSLATILLFWLKPDTILIGSLLFVVANLSFGASVVMYNSLLNDIASEEERDKISSIGWAIGYLGGGILLGLNFLVLLFKEKIGVDETIAVRISFAMAGIWWALFSYISMVNFVLPSGSLHFGKRGYSLKSTFKKLFNTFKGLKSNYTALLFLIAYLFYNDGVQTVIVVSAQFGKHELGLEMALILQVILMVQFVAFAGALLFGKIAKLISNKWAIVVSLVVWCIILLYAYLFLFDVNGFIFLSVLIAIVLGGTQALSRSLFSLLIPQNNEAEYFSIYEISEKGTSWVGPALFGLVLQFTQSYRFAILSLILFFIIGLILVSSLDVKRGGKKEVL
jgi:UMF1 family MFS transporter